MTSAQEDMIRRWERKILRRIYGGVLDAGMWRMRTNAELYELHKEPDIVTVIKQGRIRWAGHVQRMTEERAVKKVFIGGPVGRRARGSFTCFAKLSRKTISRS